MLPGIPRVGTVLSFRELADEILGCDSRIFLVYDARQAVQLQRHFTGAAALVDLDMQGEEGLWRLQHLRDRYPDLPLIAISRDLGVP